MLESSGARYFTEADWRIGERPDVLEGLARSGCVQMLMGIEALEPRFAGMGPKRDVIPRVMDAVEAIQEAGVAVVGCFVVGGDGESAASIDGLGSFLEDAPFADVQLTLQTPFPGTALRRRLEKAGRLLPDRGWSHHTLFDVTYQPDLMTVSELERRFRDLVRQVCGPGPANRRSAIREDVWRRHPGFGGPLMKEDDDGVHDATGRDPRADDLRVSGRAS